MDAGRRGPPVGSAGAGTVRGVVESSLRAAPWVLPGALGVALVAWLLRRPLARLFGVGRPHAFALVAAFGLMLVVTLTPSPVEGRWQSERVLDLAITLDRADLRTITEASLNILLFVPVGLTASRLPGALARRLLLALAVLAPIGIEIVQYRYPSLGRSGFVLNDVVANWLGLAAGALVGAVLRPARRRPRDQAGPTPRSRETESAGRR